MHINLKAKDFIDLVDYCRTSRPVLYGYMGSCFSPEQKAVIELFNGYKAQFLLGIGNIQFGEASVKHNRAEVTCSLRPRSAKERKRPNKITLTYSLLSNLESLTKSDYASYTLPKENTGSLKVEVVWVNKAFVVNCTNASETYYLGGFSAEELNDYTRLLML